MPTSTESLIASLEAQLATAKELQTAETGAGVGVVPPEPTSQMPGGVDSAPVESDVEIGESAAAQAAQMVPPPFVPPAFESTLAELPSELLHDAERDGLDILDKLKDGAPVKEIGHLLQTLESNKTVESIVKAIADIAQGVRI